MFKGNMYFYVYEGRMYWGRYGNMATQRNFYSWIFRNKPMQLNRWYISGPNKFFVTRDTVNGFWIVTICYEDGAPKTHHLRPEYMYMIQKGKDQYEIDHNPIMRRDAKNAFRNRLREYAGKYFLPYHKHARCV